MTTLDKTPIPAWLTLSDEGVTVMLRYASELNNVRTDSVFMRAPTVRDVRAAVAASGNDAEKREMSLFSSLTGVATKDLETLKLLDWGRLQEGYFRLVNEDELHAQHPQVSG